jgi:sialic acid synthase SpsE
MYKIKINENKVIGENEYPFIIAEIGNNHNGCLDTAIKLIESAKKAGADAVKFQVKNIEKSFGKELLDSSYINENSFGKTYREHKMALEFSEDQMKQLYDFAAKIDIICFSTPFDTDSVDMLERIGNPIYKISSFHVIDLKLIEHVCKTKKPIIISTGMSTVKEIDKAIELIKKYTKDFVIMHCVSCYPTEDKDVNLNMIPMLKDRYNCPVGYSGHERGIAISASTVLLGSCAIERHFTLDRTMKGPDHASSVEPMGLNDIVTRSKKLFISMGKSEKDVLDCELKNRKKFRGY